MGWDWCVIILLGVLAGRVADFSSLSVAWASTPQWRAAQQEVECGCLPSLSFPGRSTLALAKSTGRVCCHDWVGRSL